MATKKPFRPTGKRGKKILRAGEKKAAGIDVRTKVEQTSGGAFKDVRTGEAVVPGQQATSGVARQRRESKLLSQAKAASEFRGQPKDVPVFEGGQLSERDIARQKVTDQPTIPEAKVTELPKPEEVVAAPTLEEGGLRRREEGREELGAEIGVEGGRRVADIEGERVIRPFGEEPSLDEIQDVTRETPLPPSKEQENISQQAVIDDLLSQGITDPNTMLGLLNFDEQGNKINDWTISEVQDRMLKRTGQVMTVPNTFDVGLNMSTQEIFNILSDPDSTPHDLFLANSQILKDKLATTGQDNASTILQQNQLQARRDRVIRNEEIFRTLITDQAASQKRGLEERAGFLNTKLEREEARLRSQKTDTVQDLNGKRDDTIAMLKARMSLTGVALEGSFGLNTIVSETIRYDKMVQDVAQDFDDQVLDVFDKQQELMIDYTDKVEQIDNKLKLDTFSALQSYQGQLDSIDDQEIGLIREREQKKEDALIEFQGDMATLASNARAEELQKRQDISRAQNESAKNLFDSLGVISTVDREGKVVPFIDENGEPVQTWERIQEERKVKQDFFGNVFDLPKDREDFAAWRTGSELATRNAMRTGLISKEEGNALLRDLDDYDFVQRLDFEDREIFADGYEPGFTEKGIENLNNAIRNPEGVSKDLAANCVKFSRSIVADLPGGLFTFQDKLAIINSNTPAEGAVAIMDTKNSDPATGEQIGHVGVVSDFDSETGIITITESNFKSGQVSQRKGTAEQLKISGFYAGKASDPAKAAAAATAPVEVPGVGGRQLRTDLEAFAKQLSTGSIKRTALKDAGLSEAEIKQVQLRSFGLQDAELAAEGVGSKSKRFADRMIAMSNVPTQLRNSDAERELLLDGIDALLDEGKTPFEAADVMIGFRIDNKELEPLGKNLRQLALQGDADPASIARLINDGQSGKAVTLIENSLLKDVDVGLQDAQLASSTVSKANRVEKLLGQVGKKFTGRLQGDIFTARRALGQTDEEFQKAQRLASAYTDLIKEMRSKLLGSAVTETEERFLDPLIASLKDQPEIALQKIKQLKSGLMQEHNTSRRQVGLPEVNEFQILDRDLRVRLYDPSQQDRFIGPLQENNVAIREGTTFEEFAEQNGIIDTPENRFIFDQQ